MKNLSGSCFGVTSITCFTDVDVLQVDAASETSSMEEQRRGATQAAVILKNGERRGVATRTEKLRADIKIGNEPVLTGDDLRNYAYEGEGSSPGSLSSCKRAAPN